MAIAYALFSAFFAALMTILFKLIMTTEKKLDPLPVIIIRTMIVFLIALIWALIKKSSLSEPLSYHITLWLSALSMALCWFFYFKALEKESATMVGTFDKASTALTIILSILFLKEKMTIFKIIALLLIIVGTVVMSYGKLKNKNILYCFLMLIFASFMAIFNKLSATYEADLFLSLAYRMGIILGISFAIFFFQKKKQPLHFSKKGIFILIIASFATFFSWLFYFKALSLGEVSVIIPINKMSLIMIAGASYFFFHEKMSWKNFFALFCILFSSILLMFGNS